MKKLIVLFCMFAMLLGLNAFSGNAYAAGPPAGEHFVASMMFSPLRSGKVDVQCFLRNTPGSTSVQACKSPTSFGIVRMDKSHHIRFTPRHGYVVTGGALLYGRSDMAQRVRWNGRRVRTVRVVDGIKLHLIAGHIEVDNK